MFLKILYEVGVGLLLFLVVIGIILGLGYLIATMIDFLKGVD